MDEEGATRQAPEFRVVAYDQPRGARRRYYPETNPLVALASTAEGSNQPAYKSVVVRLERRTVGRKACGGRATPAP